MKFDDALKEGYSTYLSSNEEEKIGVSKKFLKIIYDLLKNDEFRKLAAQYMNEIPEINRFVVAGVLDYDIDKILKSSADQEESTVTGLNTAMDINQEIDRIANSQPGFFDKKGQQNKKTALNVSKGSSALDSEILAVAQKKQNDMRTKLGALSK